MKNILWDDIKNKANIKKHKVSFEDAATIFFDSLAVTVSDNEHSFYEFRFVTIGENEAGKLLVVFHTETKTEIGIISARKPTRTERKDYEQ
ncbi:MAG: BrnT family toxin [Pyrinomonadaceae bacterium]